MEKYYVPLSSLGNISIEADSFEAACDLVRTRCEQLCMRTDYILGNPCPTCHSKQVEIEENRERIKKLVENNREMAEEMSRLTVENSRLRTENEQLKNDPCARPPGYFVVSTTAVDGVVATQRENNELKKRIEQVKQQYESSTQRGMDLEQKLHNAQESLTAALETNVEANRLLIRARSEVHTLEKHIKQREDEIKELRQAFVKLEAAGPQYSCQLLPYGMLPNESVAQFVKRLHTDLKKAEEDSQLCRQRHREAVEERYKLEQEVERERLSRNSLRESAMKLGMDKEEALIDFIRRLKSKVQFSEDVRQPLYANICAAARRCGWTGMSEDLPVFIEQQHRLAGELEQKRVRLGLVEQERDQLVMDKARLSTLAQKAGENLRMYTELRTALGALMSKY